jgi:hypothetical protein
LLNHTREHQKSFLDDVLSRELTKLSSSRKIAKAVLKLLSSSRAIAKSDFKCELSKELTKFNNPTSENVELSPLIFEIDTGTLFDDLTRLLENKTQKGKESQESNNALLVVEDINPRGWSSAFLDAVIYIMQLILFTIAIARAFGIGDHYFVTDSASQQRAENAAESFGNMLEKTSQEHTQNSV